MQRQRLPPLDILVPIYSLRSVNFAFSKCQPFSCLSRSVSIYYQYPGKSKETKK